MTTTNTTYDVAFAALCHEIGLAVLMAQKVQFALSYYYALSVAEANLWKRSEINASITSHLGKPMGNVVRSISKYAPLEPQLAGKVQTFLASRNWLVHKFDEEATPDLSHGRKFPEYTEQMRAISACALDIMQELDVIGKRLVPNTAQTIAKA